MNTPLQVKRMSASYSTTAVKCRWRFDCLWSGICSHLRAGQTNLSKTLTSELLPEVPLSSDQAGDMLNLSVQNKQKSVHSPWGGHLKAQVSFHGWDGGLAYVPGGLQISGGSGGSPLPVGWYASCWGEVRYLGFKNLSFLKDRALLLQDDAKSGFTEVWKIKGKKE